MTMLVPLESNPDAFNAYLTQLGVRSGHVEFVDVYGLSNELLAMVARPVHAILLVFPITEECAGANAPSQASAATDAEAQARAFCKQHGVVFIEQTVGNMCGTVALLHAVLNNLPAVGPLDARGCLQELVTSMRAAAHGGGGGGDAATSSDAGELKSASELGRLVETNKALLEAHTHVATSSSLNANNNDIDMHTSLHFVCYVHAGGRCVELDGRQAAPQLHGECGDNDAFVRATAAAIEAKMAKSPDSYEFNIMALCNATSSAAQ